MISSLSVVIPAYNEQASIGAMLAECVAALDLCGVSYQITVVNDGSTDATSEQIEQWCLRCPGKIRHVDHCARKGMAQAVETAFHSGSGDAVLLLHADGQYPPSAIADCLQLLRTSDVVVFVRRQKFYGLWRHALSAAYRWLPALLFGVDLRDPGGAKCLRRSILQSVHPVTRGIFRDPERIIRAAKMGKHIAFLPVDSRPRHAGVAQGGSVRLAAHAAWDMLTLWWKGSIGGNRS